MSAILSQRQTSSRRKNGTASAIPLGRPNSDLYHIRLGRVELAGEEMLDLLDLLSVQKPFASSLSGVFEMHDPERAVVIVNVNRYFELPERIRRGVRLKPLAQHLLRARDSEYDYLMLGS
jgi:hypothetical protein